MAKIKLQNVPMEAQNENPNLMSNESDILNSSGILDDSGNLDDSGILPENGTLVIDAGSLDFSVGTWVGFMITATWESGNVNLPSSLYPAVPVTFEVEPLYEPFKVVAGTFSVSTEWFSLTGARIKIDYTAHNGVHQENGVENAYFNLPYSYIPPKK